MSIKTRIAELAGDAAVAAVQGSNVVRTAQSANNGQTGGQLTSDPAADGTVTVNLSSGGTATAFASTRSLRQGDYVFLVGNTVFEAT